MINDKENLNLYLWALWLTASVATLGSLFFSEVMGFPPCVLCWYQRIAMYPLVIIFLVGAFHSDQQTIRFAFPISILGWLIALYHNLLHYGIVPESASPCREGVSCSDIWIDWLGFITIPVLSFTAFTIINILILLMKRNIKNAK